MRTHFLFIGLTILVFQIVSTYGFGCKNHLRDCGDKSQKKVHLNPHKNSDEKSHKMCENKKKIDKTEDHISSSDTSSSQANEKVSSDNKQKFERKNRNLVTCQQKKSESSDSSDSTNSKDSKDSSSEKSKNKNFGQCHKNLNCGQQNKLNLEKPAHAKHVSSSDSKNSSHKSHYKNTSSKGPKNGKKLSDKSIRQKDFCGKKIGIQNKEMLVHPK